MKKALVQIVKDNINLGGIASDVLDEVLEPALKKVVADTSNPLDDMLMASIYPVLEAELKKLVEEQINKLLKSDEVA